MAHTSEISRNLNECGKSFIEGATQKKKQQKEDEDIVKQVALIKRKSRKFGPHTNEVSQNQGFLSSSSII